MPCRSVRKSATMVSRTSTTPSARTARSERNLSMRHSACAEAPAGARKRARATAARRRRISAEVLAVFVMLFERLAVVDLALRVGQEVPVRVRFRTDGGDDGREARVADRSRRQAAVLIGVPGMIDARLLVAHRRLRVPGDVIDGRVRLEAAIRLDALPEDVGDQRAVLVAADFPLDDGGHRDDLVDGAPF